MAVSIFGPKASAMDVPARLNVSVNSLASMAEASSTAENLLRVIAASSRDTAVCFEIEINPSRASFSSNVETCASAAAFAVNQV